MNWINSERNKFIDNLRIDIDRNLIVQVEKEIECDIVKAIVLKVIILRDTDIYIKDLLDYKIENYPLSEGYYHSGASVEENIKEILEIMEREYIKNYLTYCISYNLYPEYLDTKISCIIEGEKIIFDSYQIEEFIDELMEEERLKINLKELAIIKEDRLIDDIIDKYQSKIVEYRLAITEYNIFKEIEYPMITDYISEFIVKN